MKRFLTLMSAASIMLAISVVPALAYPNKAHPGAVSGHSGTALTGASISVLVVLLGAFALVGAAALAFGAISRRRAAAGR